MKIYLNGQFGGSGTFMGGTGTTTPQDIMTIGARNYGGWLDDQFGGNIDDVRVYNKALSDEEIRQLYIIGFVKASNASPAEGASGIGLNATLSWEPGIYASTHDVYFGTDFDDVNDASITIPLGAYRSTTDVNYYVPGGLQRDTTYYWRIDEVNDSNTWKGKVWSFTTAEVWKNEITFPDEQLKSDVISENDPGWVKFTIKIEDPCVVYFQDSSVYPFHYQFATEWLEPFIGMSAGEYYNITLYEANQEASIGAVIMPADADINEYGIQFVGTTLTLKKKRLKCLT